MALKRNSWTVAIGSAQLVLVIRRNNEQRSQLQYRCMGITL
jgi:hypothetical protein